MSDENLPYAVRKLYLNVIIRAFEDALYVIRYAEGTSLVSSKNKKYSSNATPTNVEQRYARTWLLNETDNFILVNDLAGIPHSITLRIAKQLKKDRWPNIMPKIKRELRKQNLIAKSMYVPDRW